jgi:hypothetical protein
MKRMFAVVLLSLLFPAVVTAQSYYVDATLGNNARDGQSEANAWQTIAKVNASNFLPGDSILFKCGETWREQLFACAFADTGRAAGAEPIPLMQLERSRRPCSKVPRDGVMKGNVQHDTSIWN